MEQRRRRNPAEQQLAEVIKEQQLHSQPAESQQPEQSDPAAPQLKKGQHAELLPSGGYMIITNGFEY